MKKISTYILLLLLLIQPTAQAWQWNDITRYCQQVWKENKTDLIMAAGALVIVIAAYFDLWRVNKTEDKKEQTIRKTVEQKKQAIRDELEREKQGIFQEFVAINNLDYKGLISILQNERIRNKYKETALAEIKGLFVNNGRPFSSDLLPIITIVKKYCSSLRLKIEFINTDFALEIASRGNCIYINNRRFNEAYQTLREKKAFLVHEVYHIFFNDAYYSWFFQGLYEKAPNAHLGLIQKWNHFQEKRADIYAALVNQEHALGLIKNFEQGKDQASYNHPSDATRLAYCQKVLQIYDN